MNKRGLVACISLIGTGRSLVLNMSVEITYFYLSFFHTCRDEAINVTVKD